MTDTSLLRLDDDVRAATSVVAPSWPLSSIIAVNPLSGFEHLPFEQALGQAEALFGARGHLRLGEYRDALARGRITAEALRSALGRRLGPLPAVEAEILLADLAHGPEEPAPQRYVVTVSEEHDRRRGTDLRHQLDLEIADWCAQWCSRTDIAELDEHPDLWADWRHDHPLIGGRLAADSRLALRNALERLRVPGYAQRDYLTRQVAALPGWCAHLRWRQEATGTELLAGHLAAMTTLEAHLVDGRAWFFSDGPRAQPVAVALQDRCDAVASHLELADDTTLAASLARLPSQDRELVWLDAYERSVHDPLLAAIAPCSLRAAPPIENRPAAQVVCCIDVRSEGIRRHLERTGAYETFGYAGFFGLAARFTPVSGNGGTDQCPVLLQPAHELREEPALGQDRQASTDLSHQRRVAAADDAWKAAKYHPIAPLALAEGTGWLAGPIAALRTFLPVPAARIADRFSSGDQTGAATAYDRTSLGLDTQASVVAAIANLGIVPRVAPLVVLCGHDAVVENNPMASALSCGACGGHGGAPNARAVAAMANDPEVRAVLSEQGIAIPDDSWFVAAVHDTAVDQVRILDRHLVPASHQPGLRDLEADLTSAGDRSALERASTLPGSPASVRAVRRRARDWAEPIAELGLAGNLGFVIGPRSMTAHANLGRRVFLHSYEADRDPDGAVLAGVLTAPLVVAQWINAQYYFSTTDPEQFGAGTKAVHNVLGDLGVLSGPGGDLRRGLPLQSVRAGARLLHEPVRLLAAVQGSPGHIDQAIAASVTLRQLVENQWILLAARPPGTSTWLRRSPAGWETQPNHDQEDPPWPAAL